MIVLLLALGALSLLAWLYLLLLHGGFWRADQRLAPAPAAPPVPVIAIVPARNEADVAEPTIASLLDQDYAGDLRIVLVDDGSDDGTADAARRAADAHPRGARLAIVRAPPRPAGWVGKMWALESGLRHARSLGRPTYLLLTDADIVHPPDDLSRLVAAAEQGGYDLVSLMVLLEHRGAWAGLLIPAFVYFFQQLYPFPWVNRPGSRLAAAAGGTMLVRANALERAGGIAPIKGAVIDDCALARRIKAGGPIWLGLTARTRSVRAYAGLGGIWRMVARSAYTQLDHRLSRLAAAIFGLTIVYLLPPMLVLGAPLLRSPPAALLGGAAWVAMAISFVPTLRLYRRPPWLGLLLPLAAGLYLGMTLDSAARHWRGRGAEWKGRVAAGG